MFFGFFCRFLEIGEALIFIPESAYSNKDCAKRILKNEGSEIDMEFPK
jgi:hypothetical protein